jgi:serine protease DegS
VNIYTTKVITERTSPMLEDPFFRHFFGNQPNTRQRRESSLGSGVLVSPMGYILTNNHVITGADEIAVALHDGRAVQAKLVGADPESDLAVLKIELKDLPASTLGHSKDLRVGDVVLAIGNPFGVGQTVTSGIVSALGRNSLGINTFENFIQTDAAINPGNSGGALINAYGDLVGINTAIYSQSGGSMGIGFAIPISLARDVLTQIIEHGHVIRGWLGVKIQDITPQLAESFKLKSTDGVVITNIILNGPADKAGLDRGDVITQIAGTKVRDVRETLDTISRHKPGEHISVTIIREGKEQTKEATVIERPTP